jgi:DNA-binding SARP family transcriptional activator
MSRGWYGRRVTREFRVLGPVDVRVDGVSARLAPQPRAVLAMLLLQAGQVVPSARLVDGLWGDDPPATAGNILQGYVSQLRKALGRDLVETREPGYAIHVGRDALDLHRFERLATDGARALENGQAPAAAERLREALALWSGDALADLADGDVLRPAAARLDELRLVALERRIEADLACGREADAALESWIAGAIDLAHATAPDELLDLVAGDRVAPRDVPFHRHRPTSAARVRLHEAVVACNDGGRAVRVTRPPFPPATRA